MTAAKTGLKAEMLSLPFPGNVFGISRVPAVDKDPGDYFVVCGGGGAAKTGVANAVSVVGVALDSDTASPDSLGIRANTIETVSTDERMVSCIAVDGERRLAASAAGSTVELMPLTILNQKKAIATSAENRFVAGSILPPDAGLETTTAEVESMDISSDRRLLATGQEDGRIRIWSLGQEPQQDTSLIGELRSEWRKIQHVQAMERQGRAIKRENPRKVDGLAFVASSSLPPSHYVLISRSKDGASTVWLLRLVSPAGGISIECRGAIALPCIGPNALGHRYSAVGGKRSARPGERDAGKWWHRGAFGSFDSGSNVLDLVLLESSEKGGSLLALWRLQLGGQQGQEAAASSFQFSPSVGSVSSLPGFAPEQLDPRPRSLTVQARDRETSTTTATTAPVVDVVAKPAPQAQAQQTTTTTNSSSVFHALACYWREADRQPAGAMALATTSNIKPAGKDVPLPPAIDFPLPCLLVGTQDGRVSVFDLASLKRLGQSAQPLGGGGLGGPSEPLIALSYAPQSRCVVAGVGRQVVVLPLKNIPAGGSSSSAGGSALGKAVRWCCGGHSLFSLAGLLNLISLFLLVAACFVLGLALLARSSPAAASALLKTLGLDSGDGGASLARTAPLLAALFFPRLFAATPAGNAKEEHDGGVSASLTGKTEL